MELEDYIKYCLGYIKLTRQKAISEQQKHSVTIQKEHFNLLGLLNGDLDGKISEAISLTTFYKLDPKNIPVEQKEQYEKEKVLANKIEDIYNAYRNDQYTKQVILSFGYFEIELPIVQEPGQGEDQLDIDDEFSPQKFPQSELFQETVAKSSAPGDEPSPQNTKIERYPLFSIPVLIEKFFDGDVGKYLLNAVDPEIQVNIGVLESVLGNELYFQLVREVGGYERNGKLSLPFSDTDTFIEIWKRVKAQLKLGDAIFNEQSFV